MNFSSWNEGKLEEEYDQQSRFFLSKIFLKDNKTQGISNPQDSVRGEQ